MGKNYQGSILVVDDSRKNRDVLSSLLHINNYRVIEAEDGSGALQKARTNQPDTILLDVMIPDINGFEICRILKNDSSTAHIPVIMVTVLTDQENRLKGIEAGADEFLSKPIDKSELKLRVRNAVNAKLLHDKLQASYEQLKELTRLRENLTHMIIHDLRQPITAINGYLQCIQQVESDKEIHNMITSSRSIVGQLVEMINSLLDVEKLEAGRMNLTKKKCGMSSLVRESIKPLESLKGSRSIQVESPDRELTILCDEELIRRVMINLIGNAVKYSGEEDRITVRIEDFKGGVRVSVTDTGIGIPEEFQEKIFEKFGQVEMNRPYSTGLGLTFCKMAVEAHKGEIGVESEHGRGSTFWFVLPGG